MSTQTDTSLTGIGQISINIHDLERATEFYKNKLALTHLFSVPPKMAFFECGGIRLMLAIADRPDLNHASSIIYFKVGDIDAAYHGLRSSGVRFEGEPTLVAPMQDHDLWLVELRDSENNVLALMCEKRKPS